MAGASGVSDNNLPLTPRVLFLRTPLGHTAFVDFATFLQSPNRVFRKGPYGRGTNNWLLRWPW
eukprot:5789927-Heterocapsa_arctica.AAC.1